LIILKTVTFYECDSSFKKQNFYEGYIFVRALTVREFPRNNLRNYANTDTIVHRSEKACFFLQKLAFALHLDFCWIEISNQPMRRL